MHTKEVWKKFKYENGIKHDSYNVWSFGFDADLLANLVIIGEKTATASAHLLYKIENAPLPKIGEYNIVLNSRDEPVCIIQTTRVYVTPFNEVIEAHAYKEGEGDKTLSFWKKSHKTFFTDCLKAVNQQFDEQIDIVCEEFVLRYTV